jgi:hypothetical protein
MRPLIVGAGRCHVGMAIGGGAGCQTKVEVEGGRAREAAAKDDQVATSLFEVQVRHLNS